MWGCVMSSHTHTHTHTHTRTHVHAHTHAYFVFCCSSTSRGQCSQALFWVICPQCLLTNQTLWSWGVKLSLAWLILITKCSFSGRCKAIYEDYMIDYNTRYMLLWINYSYELCGCDWITWIYVFFYSDFDHLFLKFTQRWWNLLRFIITII